MIGVIQYNMHKLNTYRNRFFKYDLIASIVLFLVAIPLCLGIALASGAPLFSGIISGVIGGVVVGSLSGSNVSVSGPAAGMAAIVLAAITQLGGFEIFLMALVVAGFIQIIIGILKAGFIAEYIPSNVIQGLLCAIGVLLITKQLPLAFTLSSSFAELKDHLLDVNNALSISPLLNISMHINTGAMIISIASIAALVYFDNTKMNWLKSIPGPIVAVFLGVGMNEVFELTGSFLAQHGPHLVNIPQHEGFMEVFSEMQRPQWSAWTNPNVYFYGALVAIVASLESLLNVKAGEKLDKSHRYCSKDQELIAQGVGNMISGLVGGIPITSVIVRTSVNIQAGSKTKLSTIFHGLFLFTAVIMVPTILNKIPLSSLAAILIYTGYKLAKPSIFMGIYKQGMDRFIPFFATFVCIVALNLLVGIVIGLVVSLFYILKSNSQIRLDIIKEIYPHGIMNRLILPQQITFLNKASLIAELDTIPKNSHLIIDAHYSDYIDKEIIELIKEYQHEQAPLKHISLNLIGFKEQYNIHNYIDFITVTTYDVQANLTPAMVLHVLREGNQRFLNDTMIHRHLKSDIRLTASTQHPIAMVLGCIDSRVPVETIFDMSFGDIFCTRIAGNVINDDILASMEFACGTAGAKLIVVLGHTSCGAIGAACNTHHDHQGHLTQLLAKIKPALNAEVSTEPPHRHGNNEHFVNAVMKFNVANTLQHIYQNSRILKNLIDEEKLGVVGAVYDVKTGMVHFHDFSKQLLQLNPSQGTELIKKIHRLVQSDENNASGHSEI